jgi:3-[(4R)-4-hydroxycyclohexa-1,5-dien-1-yl]-2-oxopropanoate isomerase
MSQFFPISQFKNLNQDVELTIFECQDTIFQLASVAPLAKLEKHQHPESQLGMVISGELEMYIDNVVKLLKPLKDVYVTDANIFHGCINPLSETMIGVDLKRISSAPPSPDYVLTMTNNQDSITNLPCQSVKGNWFEILLLKIPSGYSIPQHHLQQETIGLILNGELQVTIENETQNLQSNQVFYAPSKVSQKCYNSSGKEISLLKFLI